MSESEPNKPEPGEPASQPPPIQTTRLLDSILAQDGPMPAARLRIRVMSASEGR